MTFEFTVQPDFNFLSTFAQKFNIAVYKNRISMPESIGKGFIRNIEIEDGLKFVLHHYILKQDFHLKRIATEEKNDLISIVFNSNEIPINISDERQTALQFLKNNGSAIQISSSVLGTETFFHAGSEVYFTVIGIQQKVLSSLLRFEKPNSLLTTILNDETTFFYHENMFPEVQRILKQLSEMDEQVKLSELYQSIKIHELLYLLFDKLLNRETEKHSPVNKTDIDKIFVVRTAIIADLSSPPELSMLAKLAGMSETKLKHLFKQTFGDTVYNYYQNERMQEAAFLLKHTGNSVSETGYQLGFSNLSHFSRLFQKHFGITPKKYTSTV